MNNSVEGKDSSNESFINSKEAFDRVISNLEPEKYVFRVYVAGNSPKSVRAIQNLKRICEEHLSGKYEIEVIDIYERPELLEQEQIWAIPTVIKKLPPPLQRLIGDMTKTDDVRLGLGL